MRRKYGDCQRQDGNCTLCSLVNDGRDCRNQRVERGEAEPGNLTARNLLALADALGVDPHDLI